MTAITRAGVIGPAETLSLRSELAIACRPRRPMIALDLSRVEKLHLVAINAIIQAAADTSRSAGELVITAPTNPDVLRCLKMAGLSTWISQ